MAKKNNIKKLLESIDHLDVKINATHLNYVNHNDLYYKVSAAKDGVSSWTQPFNKPQLAHHDIHSDPLGRILSAKVMHGEDSVEKPQDFIQLEARISDSKAMENVLKGLYATVSVGSKTTKVTCSICDQVLTEEGLCEHEKGDVIDGEKCYWIIDEIRYTEDSFVNKPADPFARIVEINIGNGYKPYKEFLDNSETLINEILLEDSMNQKNAQLTAAARKKLPDSAFCGPGRSFPAQDKAHVTAGLRLLNRSNFSDNTKAKIKSCLYRKGKKYGIVPSDSELEAVPNLLTYRIDSELTPEEITAVATFFKDNPDADLPGNEVVDEGEPAPVAETAPATKTAPTETAPASDTEKAEADRKDAELKIKSGLVTLVTDKEYTLDKVKTFIDEVKPDFVTLIDTFQSILFLSPEFKVEVKDGIIVGSLDLAAHDAELSTKVSAEKDARIKELNDMTVENETILKDTTDELNKLVDELAKKDEAARLSMVDQIVDLRIATKLSGIGERAALVEKYNKRQINSLVDTINDLRSEINIQVAEVVADPTLKTEKIEQTNTDSEKPTGSTESKLPEGVDPKFAPFFEDRGGQE